MSTFPSDTPRLPKWPFLVGDAALLGIAIVIAIRSPAPFSNQVILAITGCAVLAAILGIIPFLADYAGKQDEALDERQRGLDSLTRTVANSAEQISAASTSLHELNELAREHLTLVESLPEKLQVAVQEFKTERDETLTTENKALQKELKSLRNAESKKLTESCEQIQSAIEKLSKLKVETAKKPSAPKPRPKAKSSKEEPPEATEPPVEDTTSEAPPATVEDAPAPPRETSSTPPSDPEPTPEKPSAPETEKEPVVEKDDELSLDESNEPKANHKISPDGVTRLIVSAYIGIGNRLFIRGEGPGLSADKGVPLQFVSIGKWQWDTSEATGPVNIRVYKNDEIECTALGEVTLDPGSQTEVSASF